jgi:hypothetical protein
MIESYTLLIKPQIGPPSRLGPMSAYCDVLSLPLFLLSIIACTSSGPQDSSEWKISDRMLLHSHPDDESASDCET